MKRIYCTVTNDLSYDQRMIRSCTSLSALGYEVCLIGRQLPNSKPLIDRGFAQKRLSCFFHKGKLFYLEYNLRLWLFLCFSTWDIVCSVDLDTLLPGLYAAKLRGRRCVYDAHEYFTELPELVNRPKVQAVWAWVARHGIPKVDAAYTVCGSLAEIFEREYARPFEVLRNVPMPAPKPAPTAPASPPFILLYQGVLNEGRGLETVLEALPHFPPEVELWLVGEGDRSQALREQAQALGLSEPRLRFWGYQSPEALKGITTQAHVGLNLLENKGLNYYYSLANKFFDYVQAERPSINMAFPEYERHLQEYAVGLALPELSVAALVEAVQTLRQAERYAEFQAQCRQAALVWQWPKEAEKLKAIYGAL